MINTSVNIFNVLVLYIHIYGQSNSVVQGKPIYIYIYKYIYIYIYPYIYIYIYIHIYIYVYVYIYMKNLEILQDIYWEIYLFNI